MDDRTDTAGDRAEAEAAHRACLGRAVHSDPARAPSPEQEPLPDALTRTPVENKSPAEWAYQRVLLYIRNFEEQLDNEHEVAMGFTDTGAGILKIEGIGYFDPDIVTFYGADGDGNRAQLVQHVSRLSVMLRAVRKPEPEAPPRRIGFRLAEELENT